MAEATERCLVRETWQHLECEARKQLVCFKDRDAICLASLNSRTGGEHAVPCIPLVPENFQCFHRCGIELNRHNNRCEKDEMSCVSLDFQMRD